MTPNITNTLCNLSESFTDGVSHDKQRLHVFIFLNALHIIWYYWGQIGVLRINKKNYDLFNDKIY